MGLVSWLVDKEESAVCPTCLIQNLSSSRLQSEIPRSNYTKLQLHVLFCMGVKLRLSPSGKKTD